MGYRVRWTEAAVSDAEKYADFISRDSKAYAAYFALQLRSLARSLGEMPERGRFVPGIDQENLRELISGNYRLISDK